METQSSALGGGSRSLTEMDSQIDPYTPPSETEATTHSAAGRSYRWLAISVALVPTIALVAAGLVARPRFVPGLLDMLYQLFTSWLFVFPVSLPLAGWLAWLSLRAGLGSPSFDWDRLHWLAIPAVTPFFCLAWGVVFRHSRRSVYPGWQDDVILYTLLLCFASAVAAVIANRRHRWITIAAGLNCFLLCFGSAFLAGMSVSGDWL
ncbi:hypothetical protein Pla100_36760 [Neorhodopirellula pilleata]|uniref:Transmembrane protein n=1 Tax=Neorhodopirellula pilleata TaxID=2714738 RepID=A0A5C6A6T7_9BACT|nr:hypothetical protein Pla100_36760 [Neorhodopirellula pilleata]